MASESARATSAAESRYRIDAPNSQPRTVKVIALDAAAELVVKRIAQGPWRRATFFTSLTHEEAPRGAWSMQAWLGDVAGRAMDLVEEIASEAPKKAASVRLKPRSEPANQPKAVMTPT